MLSIGKLMILRVTTVASNDWFRYPIWRGISRLLGTKGHPRSGCISQDTHMHGLYYRNWDRSIYWNEKKYIKPGRTMKFWKLLYSFCASKNDCCGCRWTFSGMFKKIFQETLLIPVHAVERGNHKTIRNEVFHRYSNNLQKIKWAEKGSLHQWLQGVFFALYS